MPRSTDGSYSLPAGSLVSSGDTIMVSQHNPPFQDIAQSLTNSLDRDGRGGMRAPLNMGGNPIQNVANGTNPSDVATVGQLTTSAAPVPVGSIFDYAGSTAPTDYLLCYGQAVPRVDFPDLFTAIGTAFGAGDGSTTFNIPDYRGRVGAGKDNMGGATAGRLDNIASTTLGGVGGSKDHTLTSAQMPSHTHTVTDPGHTHSQSTVSFIGSGGVLDGGSNQYGNSSAATGSAMTGVSIANTGGGGAHNNVQPTLILNKIIKARNS